MQHNGQFNREKGTFKGWLFRIGTLTKVDWGTHNEMLL